MRLRLRLLMALSALTLTQCGDGAGVAVIEFVEVLPARPRIGDVATVRFRLLDPRGVPLAGAPVEFSLDAANEGVKILPARADSLVGSGYAETQLVASSRVNSVIVVASAGDKTVRSPPITFAGTVPSGRQLTFQCGPFGGNGTGGVHAIGAYDQSRYLIAGSSVDCTAHVGDRNGDGVENALVSFLTEAGTIGPTSISLSNLVGDATVTYKTSYPLPLDVPPGQFSWSPQNDATHTGEYLAPLWMHPFNWRSDPTLGVPPGGIYDMNEPQRPDPIRLAPDGQRNVNNRRDNLVTMIAVTSGEEGFTDSNNNGVWDQGEPFDDLTEPFVDANDNGTWDVGELFIDANNDLKWTGKNGEWDANTFIWRQERILWTGMPIREDVESAVPGVPGHIPVFSPASCLVPGDCPGDVIDMDCPRLPDGGLPVFELPDGGVQFYCAQALGRASLGPVQLAFYISDPWFNPIARNADGDTCAVAESENSPVRVTTLNAAGRAFTYPSDQFVRIQVSDVRDPSAKPIDQIPFRAGGVGFSASVECLYTSSPREGFLMRIPVTSIRGSIE